MRDNQNDGVGIVKIIFTSVAASLLTAAIVSLFVFTSTVSKMNVMIDNLEKRVAFIEADVKESRDDRRSLHIEFARYMQVLDIIRNDVQEVKTDIKGIAR